MEEKKIILFESQGPGKFRENKGFKLTAYARTHCFTVETEEEATREGYPVGTFWDKCTIALEHEVDLLDSGKSHLSGHIYFDFLENANWLMSVLQEAIKAIETYDNPEARLIYKRESDG